MAIIKINNNAIDLNAAEIPNLDASKITTGTLSADRIDNNSLANVTALPFSAGTDWQSTIVTGSTLTAVAGKGYWIDTTSNACTITLPASASVGDFIEFVDYARTWGTNAITINQNSLNFQGESSVNPIYNTDRQSINIVYSGATQGWIPVSDDDVTYETFSGTFVEYLAIGGGGSGGKANGGAGGAGGYLTNYGDVAIEFNTGTTYTLTVGAGGASVSASGGGNDGNDTTITGTGLTTITAFGGGYGGSSNGTAGNSGGSGGGGGYGQNGGSGTLVQGTNGGNGSTGSASPEYGAGGGGGALTAGSNGTSSGGGNGGDGLSSSITGSAITRAGGGGGSCDVNNVNAGVGGAGGGGNGTRDGTAGAGTVNTGSGGGGQHAGTSSGAGGSGVVILKMLTSKYTGTTTGSPTVTTVGTDTILTYTGTGTYTA